jgi:hypothetical protein
VYEYGGFAVTGHVAIGGREVSISVRYIGDDYYCAQWERDLLARRAKLGAMFVPSTENMFYSLLYHVLVHNRTISDRLKQSLGETGSSVKFEGDLAKSDEQLWCWLDRFMTDKGYEYVRPKDLSIPLSTEAKKRIGIKTSDDLRAAQNFIEERRPLDAIDLLVGILADEPNHRLARHLMLTAERQSKEAGAILQFIKSIALTRVGQMLPLGIRHSVKRLLFLPHRWAFGRGNFSFNIPIRNYRFHRRAHS